MRFAKVFRLRRCHVLRGDDDNMPPKRPYFMFYSIDDRVRVRITTDRGRVIHFTAQYETYIEGEWHPVMRCDSAHGQAHVDYLDHRGNKVGKTELGFFFPFDEALQWSLEDFATNWPRYKERFIQRKDRS